ncbi:hypothetical protein GCM10009554_40590 [Kribbella koreensis]|uniref:Uncharacterized protein n=2 Tax=Kribbella TaxID=182639 RepID=A0ABP6VPK3_9ACTN
MEALYGGILTVDASGCVQVQGSQELVTLVWPKGYTVRGDSRSFEILDGGKNVVARSATHLAISGGGADKVQDTWTERECVTGSKLWMVGSIREG